MEIQEIEVTIDKDGQVKLHVRGVKGGACLSLTEDLIKALGGAVMDQEMTPEALDAPNSLDQSLYLKQKPS